MAEDGEEFDARRQHRVPAALLDPQRHFVLRPDAGFGLQPELLPFTFCLQS